MLKMSGLEELIPYAWYGSSIIMDIGATYLNVKKHGSGVEGSDYAREIIAAHGARALLTRRVLEEVVFSSVAIAPLYGADWFFGIHDAPINLHKAFLYVVGSVKYLQAAAHLADYSDNKYASCVYKLVGKINNLLLKDSNRTQ